MEAKNTTLFINFKEAAHICDKSQYNESTWWERFRLVLRMTYCKITRAYVKKNKKLTRLVQDNDVVCMDNHMKSDLKALFEQELKKNLD